MLDLRDRRILTELDRDARISLTDLAHKLSTSKEVVHYRINKLVQEEIILQFHTVSALYRFGQKAYKIYLRLHGATQTNRQEIFYFLLQHKDVFWIGDCRGAWDIIVGVWAKDLEDFYSVHDDLINRFSQHIIAKEVSISRRNFLYSRGYLIDDKRDPVIFTFGEGEPAVTLTETQSKVLNAIATNSRLKLTEIAQQTGLHVNAVRTHLRQLEKSGIIKGYKCLYNAKKLGYFAAKSNIFLKNIDHQKKQRFMEYLKQIPNAIYVLDTFAAWDMELGFEVETQTQYYDIMDKIANDFQDIITRYDAILVLEEPKQRFVVK